MEGIYAKFNTSKGLILLKLNYKETPGTVGNFVSLAEGTQKNSYKNWLKLNFIDQERP